MLFGCVALVLSAADAPRLLDPEVTTVDFEELHFEVRRLDSQILVLPTRMPIGFGLGTSASLVTGVVALALGIGYTIPQAGPGVEGEAVWRNAPFYFAALSGLVMSVVLVVMGFDALKAANVERVALIRRRDAALLKLSALER